MRKKFEIAIVVLAITGVLIEVVSYMFEDPFSVGRGLGLIRYYTIQSNTILFVYLILGFKEKIRQHPLYEKMLPGVVLYITITFMVFATLLQGTFEIPGIRKLGNILVHYVVPVLAIYYLFKYGESKYTYKDTIVWIIYPLVYIMFMFIYGTITNDYLYPFFNLNVVPIWGVLTMIGILMILFVSLSFIVVKILSKKKSTNNV